MLTLLFLWYLIDLKIDFRLRVAMLSLWPTICQVYCWSVFNNWAPKVAYSEILFICLPGRHYFSSRLNRNSLFLPRHFIKPSNFDCINFVGIVLHRRRLWTNTVTKIKRKIIYLISSIYISDSLFSELILKLLKWPFRTTWELRSQPAFTWDKVLTTSLMPFHLQQAWSSWHSWA